MLWKIWNRNKLCRIDNNSSLVNYALGKERLYYGELILKIHKNLSLIESISHETYHIHGTKNFKFRNI